MSIGQRPLEQLPVTTQLRVVDVDRPVLAGKRHRHRAVAEPRPVREPPLGRHIPDPGRSGRACAAGLVIKRVPSKWFAHRMYRGTGFRNGDIVNWRIAVPG